MFIYCIFEKTLKKNFERLKGDYNDDEELLSLKVILI